MMTNVPHYSQADPRWGANLLGRNRTLKQAGCLVTCCAMLVSWKTGKEVLPSEVDKWLDINKGYQGDALIWSKMVEFAKSKGIDWNSIDFVPSPNDSTFRDREGTLPILEVKTTRGTSHYILMLDDDTFHDPGTKLGANKKFIGSKYKPVRLCWFDKK